jgi:hypothetical protein
MINSPRMVYFLRPRSRSNGGLFSRSVDQVKGIETGVHHLARVIDAGVHHLGRVIDAGVHLGKATG